MFPRIKARARKLKQTVRQTEGSLSGRPSLPRLDATIAVEPGRFEAVYFRAAQAYMLISMPTGTSTIFGVFQVIASSQ